MSIPKSRIEALEEIDRRIRRWKTLRRAGIITIVGVIGVGTFVDLEGKREEQERVEKRLQLFGSVNVTPGNAGPSYGGDASALILEFDKNEVRADIKYASELVEISGAVRDIGKDANGTVYILVGRRSGIGPRYPRSVQCFFSESKEFAVARLSVGQRVNVEGRVDGMLMNNVVMKRCKLIPMK